VRPCELLGDLHRPVARSVVDEYEPVGRARLGRYRIQERRQMAFLVEKGDDDNQAQEREITGDPDPRAGSSAALRGERR
jgi:hypothetical protein